MEAEPNKVYDLTKSGKVTLDQQRIVFSALDSFTKGREDILKNVTYIHNFTEIRGGSFMLFVGDDVSQTPYAIQSAERMFIGQDGQIIIENAQVVTPTGDVFSMDLQLAHAQYDKDTHTFSVKSPNDVLIKKVKNVKSAETSKYEITPDQALALARDPKRLQEEMEQFEDDPLGQKVFIARYSAALAEKLVELYGVPRFEEDTSRAKTESWASRFLRVLGLSGDVSVQISRGLKLPSVSTPEATYTPAPGMGIPGRGESLKEQAIKMLHGPIGAKASVGAAGKAYGKAEQSWIHEEEERTSHSETRRWALNVAAYRISEILEDSFENAEKVTRVAKTPEAAERASDLQLLLGAQTISGIVRNIEQKADSQYKKLIDFENEQKMKDVHGVTETQKIMGDKIEIPRTGPIDVRGGWKQINPVEKVMDREEFLEKIAEGKFDEVFPEPQADPYKTRREPYR